MMPPLSGHVPDDVVQAMRDRLYKASASTRGLGTQAFTANWRMPVMLVSFADDTLHYSAGDFERLLFDTTHAIPTGSVAEYWKWVSRGRVRLTGRVVATVRLPEPESFYAADTYGLTSVLTPRNVAGYAKDALRIGQGSVNWTEFDQDFDGFIDMVWLIHAGVGGEGGDPNKLLTFTTLLTGGWNNAGAYPTSTFTTGTSSRPMYIDRFTVLPEMSLFHPDAQSEIGPFAHEFGHTLGLPDLYDLNNVLNVGPGNWSLMSSGVYGGDNHSPETPVHLGAWPMQLFGWDHTIRPTRDSTITLAPLEQSTDLIELWPQGEASSEHFVIENRRRIDYDRNLPGEGLLVYHVTPGAIPVLLEADGDGDLQVGRNRGDANDPLPGALDVTRLDDFTQPPLRAFDNKLTNVSLEDVVLDGVNTTVRARVRPIGWQPPEDWTSPGFTPVASRTPAHTSGQDDASTEYVVISEYLNGRPQVVLRTSNGWGLPLTLSHTTGAALDPTLAILPGGDLGVAWSDSRRGRAEIYYRARILGQWTVERPIVSLSGSCRTPALGCDARGGMYLAFQYQSADTVRLMFERFNYASAVGQPVAVTSTPVIPGNPTVCAGEDGRGYLLWQDRTPGGMIWFGTFDRDTRVQSIQPLSWDSRGSTTYAAVMDAVGSLYVLWNQSSAQVNQLLFQTWLNYGSLPDENVFETLPLPLQSLALEVDAERSIHIAYALAGASGLTLRYRRKWPNDQWDVTSTDLTFPDGSPGGEPIVLPRLGGNVDIAYTGVSTQTARFMIRRRVLTPEQHLETTPSSIPAVARLWVAPNPVRAGSNLELRAGAQPVGGDAMIDVFDTGGRRVAIVPLATQGDHWGARIPATVTRVWPSGMYFARLRGGNGTARVVVVR